MMFSGGTGSTSETVKTSRFRFERNPMMGPSVHCRPTTFSSRKNALFFSGRFPTLQVVVVVLRKKDPVELTTEELMGLPSKTKALQNGRNPADENSCSANFVKHDYSNVFVDVFKSLFRSALDE